MSVLIPCYGPAYYAEFMREAVKSVQEQTVSDWEIVIATDEGGALTVAREIARGDGRIRILGGVASVEKADGHARNATARGARAAFLLPLDPDDTLFPTYLEEVLGVVPRFEPRAIVGTDLQEFGLSHSVHAWPHPAPPFSDNSPLLRHPLRGGSKEREIPTSFGPLFFRASPQGTPAA